METLVAAAFSQLLGCEVNDIDADFFALGGHSLLAMRGGTAQPPAGAAGDPGQVMVASTVGKLSALLAADLSDEQAQRPGWIRFCRCASDGPTLFCFHPASGFAGSSASGALSQPALVDYRYSVAAPAGRWPAPPASTRCASIICARCWRSRTALITCSGIRWAAP